MMKMTRVKLTTAEMVKTMMIMMMMMMMVVVMAETAYREGDADHGRRNKKPTPLHSLSVHMPPVQFSVAWLSSSHILPRWRGAGAVHSLARCLSHWALHGLHSPHSSQPPSTVKQKHWTVTALLIPP